MARPLHIHVEEPSMEAFLEDFLPRYLDPQLSWKIIDHNSKWQLLQKLPHRLAGYARIPIEYRPKTLVLVDRDDDDCLILKARLESFAANANLVSKTAGDGVKFEVVNRIVVEELEAWFFGDVQALAASWPGVPLNLGARAGFRDPDAIVGGTHEVLLRVLQRAGHLRSVDRLPKIDTARRMAGRLESDRCTSRSFQQFLTGLDALVSAV